MTKEKLLEDIRKSIKASFTITVDKTNVVTLESNRIIEERIKKAEEKPKLQSW